MPKIPLCDFGKMVRRRLDDIGQTQKWLIAEVHHDTGLYFDSRYLHKILTGRIETPTMIASIAKILCIATEAAQ